MCSSVVIVESLMVHKTSQAFPSIALQGFPSVREKDKRLNPQFHCLRARGISPSKYYFLNPYGEDVKN